MRLFFPLITKKTSENDFNLEAILEVKVKSQKNKPKTLLNVGVCFSKWIKMTELEEEVIISYCLSLATTIIELSIYT